MRASSSANELVALVARDELQRRLHDAPERADSLLAGFGGGAL
jgi:hypothetical protein